VEASPSRSSARKKVKKRRFSQGDLSLISSKIRKIIVTEISTGKNIFSGTNKPALGRDKPAKMCHSRRGSSLIFQPKAALTTICERAIFVVTGKYA